MLANTHIGSDHENQVVEAPAFTRQLAGVAVAMGVVLALLWALPYWSIAGLLKSASNNEFGQVEGFLDTGRIRNMIAVQTHAAVESQAIKAIDKGWAGAEAALNSDRSRPLAAQLSNLPAVTELIRSHLPANGTRLGGTLALWNSEHREWLSASEYQVTTTGDYHFTWKRHADGWRLAKISIPQHVLEAAAITGPSAVIQPDVQTFKHP